MPTSIDATAQAPVTAGRDAHPGEGLPRRSELPLATRLVVHSSAAFDVCLRTAAASLVAASFAPLIVNPGFSRRERGDLRFYAELAAQRDTARSFPEPPSRPAIRARKAGPLSFRFAEGHVDLLRFDSPFETINPSLRQRYASYTNNAVAWAQHWRHHDAPRPTICVIHGFMGSAYLLNGQFFSLPWFFRAGYDVLLYTLPFHGGRRERWSPYSGYGYFAHGIAVLNEAMAHAVHDFRVFVDHLKGQGVEQVGVTGLSLGGYTAALLAAVEPRLKVVIPNVPVTDMATLFPQWAPAGTLLAAGSRLGVFPADELNRALAFHSPLNYPPVVAKERRLIITGLGDRLAPPGQSELLWEHWDRCQLYWFPGNHVGHLNQSSYLRRMARFMRGLGFAPAAWLASAAAGAAAAAGTQPAQLN
ncbi:MAG: alpha/beta hydrolase family protein [Acidimicrobiales bacterium]